MLIMMGLLTNINNRLLVAVVDIKKISVIFGIGLLSGRHQYRNFLCWPFEPIPIPSSKCVG
jgi:hypothetical protein